MGYSEKPQMDVESEPKKWVIAGITLRSPLKPIFTNPAPEKKHLQEENDGGEECSTTPTAEEAKIPSRPRCPPPPPRKRKASSKCHFSGVREFFTPPDLETVFIRRYGRA